MEPQELQKNIALYYSKLPPKLQESFSSMKWLEALNAISTKYGLKENQTQTLGTETTLVLLGIISLKEYNEILRKELSLSGESLEKILSEINNSIINPVPELINAFESNTKPQTPEELKIEQELDARFEKLPGKIQNIINDSNYQTRLYDIAKNYGLSVTQMGTLEIIFVDLVTGAIHADKFEESIKDKLQLPSEKAHTLAGDINEKILKEIRIKMVDLSSQKEKEEERDTDILKSAGIEIIPEKLELNSSPRLVEEGAGDGDSKNPPHPILTQKLSGFVKSNVVETEHSLHNLTPDKNQEQKPRVDPYREIPE